MLSVKRAADLNFLDVKVATEIVGKTELTILLSLVLHMFGSMEVFFDTAGKIKLHAARARAPCLHFISLHMRSPLLYYELRLALNT